MVKENRLLYNSIVLFANNIFYSLGEAKTNLASDLLIDVGNQIDHFVSTEQ